MEMSSANKLTCDLLVEILSRLPVKSLYRFACVSKSWNAIITNNNGYYRKKLPSPLPGVFYEVGDEFDEDSVYVSTPTNHLLQEDSIGFDIKSVLGFLPQHHKLLVQSTCNGLILCSTRPDKCLYVCNPATKRYHKIPEPADDHPYQMALAFDPRLSPHYKVVAMINRPDTNYMEILSSETREWVKYEDCKGRINHAYTTVSAFVRGNLHFLDLYGSFILAVDLKKKVCREIETPSTKDPIRAGCIQQFGGSLRCALRTREEIFVWDLVDYDNLQWRSRYRVDLQRFIEQPRQGLWFWLHIKVSALHPDTDVIFIVIGYKLLSYNLITREITQVCKLRGMDPVYFCTYSPCYSDHLH
ncbi:uncharacterized protein A4U43_C08F5200 [Asparagus officinalis]|uniref:F-box protein At5g49610-like n=1 Tax=Asparagus officinalis TaxID=4686 RepID=UPI00098E6676|nr:F-box protein At5g49610-like [Asparagus officinalis]ONK59317.1 uncharacterized protein A4U43_C08F5200 [Asparagus officinalis]